MAFSANALRRATLAATSAAGRRAGTVSAPAAPPAAPAAFVRPSAALRLSASYTAGCQVRSFAGAAVPVGARADELIKDHACVIFTKSTCPFCVMARNVLEKTGAKHSVMEMDKEMPPQDVEVLQQHFQKITGARSVPRVFIGGTCIGGGDDTADLYESGELKTLLEKAGAL